LDGDLAINLTDCTTTSTQNVDGDIVDSYNIGQGRRVEVRLSDDKSYILIKRFYTAEEKCRMDSDDDGVVVVLERVQVKKLLNNSKRLRRRCDKLTLGRSVDLMHSLGQDLFVCIQPNSYVVHIRRYWMHPTEKEWKATKMGVTIRPYEAKQLLTHLPILEKMLVWSMSSSGSDADTD
jgi:hypothetical protein